MQHLRVGVVVGSAWALWDALMIAERASGLTGRAVNWADVPVELVFLFTTGWVGGTAFSWLHTGAPKLRWPIAAAVSGICALLPLVLGSLARPGSIFRTDALPVVLLILVPLAAIFGIVATAIARYGLFAKWAARAHRWAMRPNARYADGRSCARSLRSLLTDSPTLSATRSAAPTLSRGMVLCGVVYCSSTCS